MKTWWLVVRHANPADLAGVVCHCADCKGEPSQGEYPPEGFAVSAFDDEERAKAFAVNSTSKNHQYESIPVVRAK